MAFCRLSRAVAFSRSPCAASIASCCASAMVNGRPARFPLFTSLGHIMAHRAPSAVKSTTRGCHCELAAHPHTPPAALKNATGELGPRGLPHVLRAHACGGSQQPSSRSRETTSASTRAQPGARMLGDGATMRIRAPVRMRGASARAPALWRTLCQHRLRGSHGPVSADVAAAIAAATGSSRCAARPSTIHS